MSENYTIQTNVQFLFFFMTYPTPMLTAVISAVDYCICTLIMQSSEEIHLQMPFGCEKNPKNTHTQENVYFLLDTVINVFGVELLQLQNFDFAVKIKSSCFVKVYLSFFFPFPFFKE